MEQLTSEITTNIVKALLQVQKEVDAVRKDSKNPYFKSNYANIESVLDVVKEPLNTNGIVLLQPVVNLENGEAAIVTTLLHESGEWLRSIYPLGNRAETPQAQGSQVTYARRYSLISFLSLEQEDDDGNVASVKKTPVSEPQKATDGVKPTVQARVEALREDTKDQTNVRLASEAQRKYVWVLGKKNDLSEEAIKEMFNLSSFTEMTFDQADGFIKQYGDKVEGS